MTEAYISGRDAYLAGEAAAGRVKMRGPRLPDYVKDAAPKKPGLSGQNLWNALDAMHGRLLH